MFEDEKCCAIPKIIKSHGRWVCNNCGTVIEGLCFEEFNEGNDFGNYYNDHGPAYRLGNTPPLYTKIDKRKAP